MNTDTPSPDYGESWRVMPYADGGVGTREARPIIEDLRLSRRAVACVNACAGLADPTAHLAAMREAIKEAHDALQVASSKLAGWHGLYPGQLGSDDYAAEISCEATLTKLQPFLK